MNQAIHTTLPQPANVPAGELGLVPYEQTPPWDEYGLWDAYIEAPVPPVDLREQGEAEALITAPAGYSAYDLGLAWDNDPQYGWPPPGAPNEQPFMSGHTQIVVHDPTDEQGWGQDPAFAWPARYPHMEGHNPYYGMGIARRNGSWPVAKNPLYYTEVMEQVRNMSFRRYQRTGRHGVIVAGYPSVTNTANTFPVQQAGPYSTFDYPTDEGVPPDA